MQTYQGECHCGKVAFEIQSDVTEARMCNCSICKKRNGLMHLIPRENFKILRGEEEMSKYQFNTMQAEHYFCKTCGIYTFHRPRTKPDFIGVNTHCLEGIEISKVKVEPANGKELSTVS